MRIPRSIFLGHRNYQNGHVAVSPFVDRKIYEYSIFLLRSAYLLHSTEKVFDYLMELLGTRKFITILNDALNENKIDAEIVALFYEFSSFSDFDDVVKLFGKNQFIQIIRNKVIPELEKKINKTPSCTALGKRLEAVQKMFKLSAVEVEIITFLFVCEMSPTSKALYEIDDLTEKAYFINRIGSLIGYSKAEVRRALGKGNLIKAELIDGTHRPDLADWLQDFLHGINTSLNDSFFTRFQGKSLPLEDHLADIKELDVLMEFLQMPGSSNILLYGEPGTGKTELVKSVSAHLGKDLCVINNKENASTTRLKSAVIATCNITDRKQTIILVDEADDLLNTQLSYFFTGDTNSKSWINQFLDENTHKVIWISNRTWGIEDSTLRRFAFSMKFKKFSLKKKVQVFKHCLKNMGLENFLTEADIIKLCGRYSVNAGGIADALKNLKIRKTSRKQAVLEKLEIVLKNHQVAISGQDFKRNSLKEMDRYDPEVLNTSENVGQVVSIVNRFMTKLEDEGDRRIGSMNLLFYGPPGSGKTEFVKYLGKATNKEIVYKRSSDLLSCYVGGTEKNIATAFEKAEGDQAILFLDEVDSFLSPRENARNSWEKTEVNELLTQMENFNGVLVCATNFIKGLDQAAMRRFKFKIEFKALNSDGNLKMYISQLLSLTGKQIIPPEVEREIRHLEHLTPGDFHVVAEKYGYLEEHPSHQELIGSLKVEASHKPRTNSIGFAA